MDFIDADKYTGDRAWDAQTLAVIHSASIRLHWTDEPYEWHINDGEEVFVVVEGVVAMHYRSGGVELVETLVPGRICVARAGDEHVAVPQGIARILVVEQAGSV